MNLFLAHPAGAATVLCLLSIIAMVVASALNLRHTRVLAYVIVLSLLWDPFLLLTLGGSSWRWVVIASGAALLLIPWWRELPVFWKAVMPSPPVFAEYDPVEHPIPERVLDSGDRFMLPLIEEGFSPMGSIGRSGPQVERLTVLRNEAELAHATVILRGRGANWVRDVNFCSILPDGRWLYITNSRKPQTPASVPGMLLVLRCPDIRDAKQLWQISLELAERAAAGGRRSMPPGSDAVGVMVARSEMQAAGLVTTGFCRPVQGGYRFAPLAAIEALWRNRFPLWQLKLGRARAAQDELLRELGRPIPSPRESVWSGWQKTGGDRIAAAAAIIVCGFVWPVLVRPGGLDSLDSMAYASAASPQGGPETLPENFSVPADFPGAVRALEKLAGVKATPVVADDGRYGTPTPAMMVAVDSSRLESLTIAAQPLFLTRGFLLFRVNEYSIHEKPSLALWPSADQTEIVEKMQTSGANYGLTPAQVAEWLRGLERDHPFILNRIGPDYVGGRFVQPLSGGDADELARRVYRFCPDVVNQGTRTVSALATEMRDRQSFYCWWD